MKNPIPTARADDVLHILWLAVSELESKCDRPVGKPGYDPYQQQIVTSAYNILNDIGYTAARPAWETRAKTP